jgi:hypothetical protein
MPSNKKKTFILEGVINGTGFREVISLPGDSGGGTTGGGEVAINRHPIVIVLPVVVLASERQEPKPKR